MMVTNMLLNQNTVVPQRLRLHLFYQHMTQRDIREDVPFALAVVAKTVFFFGCSLIFYGKKFLPDSVLASLA